MDREIDLILILALTAIVVHQRAQKLRPKYTYRAAVQYPSFQFHPTQWDPEFLRRATRYAFYTLQTL